MSLRLKKKKASEGYSSDREPSVPVCVSSLVGGCSVYSKKKNQYLYAVSKDPNSKIKKIAEEYTTGARD